MIELHTTAGKAVIPHSQTPSLPNIGLTQALHWSTPVDAVAVKERAASLSKRSIKKQSKIWGMKLAISMVDITTLEGQDSPGKVESLCRKAIAPDPLDRSMPSCAAVCVYPAMVPLVRKFLAGSTVKTASVATGFPSGQTSLSIKLEETRQAVDAGAQEIDMVISRGAFHAGQYQAVYDEIAAVKEACGDAHLKVILETGELGTFDNIRKASFIAMCAGGDFIKTSTGKIDGKSTAPITLLMLEAVRDFYGYTGRMIGMKPAGNIPDTKTALAYLVLVYETLGAPWMTPDLFRFGASTLVNDLLMQIHTQATGAYQSPDYFSKD